MNSNTISVSATCIVIGLGGFVLGKITSGKAGLSEQDRLLASAERSMNQHSISRDRTNTKRPSQQRDDNGIDQKLAKLEDIARSENLHERGRTMLKWIDSLAPSEFEAAATHLARLDLRNYERDEYLMMLLAAWAAFDPVSALAHVTNNDHKFIERRITSRETLRRETADRDGTIYDDGRRSAWTSFIATSTVLSAWVSRDPEAAIAWAKSNYHGRQENPHMHGIILGLAEFDPARANALLQEMPKGGLYNLIESRVRYRSSLPEN